MVCGPPGINAHAFGATVLLPHSAPYGAVGPRIDMGQMWGCGGLQGWEGRYWGQLWGRCGFGGQLWDELRGWRPLYGQLWDQLWE